MKDIVLLKICEIEEHDLDKYEPELRGDGTNTVDMFGKCKNCGMDIHLSYSTYENYYAVYIPNFSNTQFPGGLILEKRVYWKKRKSTKS